MELNIRRLIENDWSTLESWWNAWDRWIAPPKDFLPDNGTGGLIVESNGTPVVAGFLYFTNSKGGLLEWVISNPEYKEDNRKEAIALLLTAAENVFKDKGVKYLFSIGRNKHLIQMHKELGWTVDKSASYEISKVI